MTKKEQIQQEAEKLKQLLNDAYEIAGSLRDTFSSWPDNYEMQGYMKERCNNIRGQLYESKNDARLLIRAINQQS